MQGLGLTARFQKQVDQNAVVNAETICLKVVYRTIDACTGGRKMQLNAERSSF